MAGLIDLNGLGHFKAKENAMVADTYSASKTYAVGDYVYYNGTLYRCTTAISTTEAWTAGHWTAVKLADDCSALKTEVMCNEVININDYPLYKNGIASNGKWNSGATNSTRSVIIHIPYGAESVTLQTINGSTFAFLQEQWGVPVAGELAKLSTEYPSRIVTNTGTTVTYKITGTMRNLFVLTSTSAGVDTKPTSIVFRTTKESEDGVVTAIDTDTEDETGKTDMSSQITAMLNRYGRCRLGKGIFYINSGIDMPSKSMLCGCGDSTIIRLMSSSSATYAVRMSEYCTLDNISVSGAYASTDITVANEGTRNGVEFIANYDGEEGETTYQSQHCMISNVWIRNFSGIGLRCHNTSINYAKGLYVNNAYIHTCHKGINIDEHSEFNKFTNVCVAWCYYACVNNGGNNAFTACTFHATSIGFYIDGTKANAAHGIINGCTFCHIGSNTGSAITLSNIVAGFVFANSQFWYNSIDIDSCNGIVFSGCEFGRGTTGNGATINIDGGNLILFSGCVFNNDVDAPPDITITNNTKVKFDSCYGGVSGNAITA